MSRRPAVRADPVISTAKPLQMLSLHFSLQVSTVSRGHAIACSGSQPTRIIGTAITTVCGLCVVCLNFYFQPRTLVTRDLQALAANGSGVARHQLNMRYQTGVVLGGLAIWRRLASPACRASETS